MNGTKAPLLEAAILCTVEEEAGEVMLLLEYEGHAVSQDNYRSVS